MARSSFLVLVAVALVPQAIQGQAEAPVMEDPALVVSGVASGLDSPTSMAFLARGDFLVLEKNSGLVERVKGGSLMGPVFDLAVNKAGERGALGIALHPGFSSNGLVYVFWTWKGSGVGPGGLEGSDSSDPLQVPLLGNRVDRFVWNGSRLVFDRNILRLPSRWVPGTLGRILTGHSGGVLEFGPDGELYVLVGDEHLRGKLQNILGGPRATDENLTGVILRLQDDGSTPTDNPFFQYGEMVGGEVGRNLQLVFAYGIRNSFGMAFDPVARNFWMEENGDDAFDEVQRVPPGFNSRWIQLMGPNDRYQEYRAIELATDDGLDNPKFPPEDLAATADSALARLYDLPGSVQKAPAFSWKFPQGVAAIGFVGSMALGPGYFGDLIAGDTQTGSLYRFELDADRRGLVFEDPRLADGVADNAYKGDLTESESLTIGSGFGIAADIETGPNGDLYVVSFTAGKVYRISRR